MPDRLFQNDGAGRFTDVSEKAGISDAFGNGLGVVCGDFNADGWPDIYVANDGNANQLWENKNDGSFEDVGLMAGVAYSADGLPQAGMGVAAGDFDNDADEDLFVTNLAFETNALYLNNGRGQFHDVTDQYLLGGLSSPYTGFGVQWFDYDNDGWLDLYVANGAVTIEEPLRGTLHPFHQRNLLIRSLQGGAFQNVADESLVGFALSEVSRGMGVGDVDNDGDSDLLVSNNNGRVRLLLNEVGAHQHWLRVRLRGSKSNREGIGSRVALFRAEGGVIWRRVSRDGSYLSASDAAAHFGLGGESGNVAVGVVWPNGRGELWTDVSVDREIALEEGGGRKWSFDGRSL